jgi:hypothetical protein
LLFDLLGRAAQPLDPLLGPLQYNGGPTLTQALLAGSPASRSGAPGGPHFDQRGVPRDHDHPSIGAYEYVDGPASPRPPSTAHAPTAPVLGFTALFEGDGLPGDNEVSSQNPTWALPTRNNLHQRL